MRTFADFTTINWMWVHFPLEGCLQYIQVVPAHFTRLSLAVRIWIDVGVFMCNPNCLVTDCGIIDRQAPVSHKDEMLIGFWLCSELGLFLVYHKSRSLSKASLRCTASITPHSRTSTERDSSRAQVRKTTLTNSPDLSKKVREVKGNKPSPAQYTMSV